jgi:hypothetical protein
MNDQIVAVILGPFFVLLSLLMIHAIVRAARVNPNATTPLRRRIAYGIFGIIILGSLLFGINGLTVLQSERTVSRTCEIQHIFEVQQAKGPDYSMLETTCGKLDVKHELGVAVGTGIPYRFTYTTAHGLFGQFTPEVKSITQ